MKNIQAGTYRVKILSLLKKKKKNGSVILKIKWTGDISSLCLSVSVAYGFCTLNESQWSIKCKSQEASSLYT